MARSCRAWEVNQVSQFKVLDPCFRVQLSVPSPHQDR